MVLRYKDLFISQGKENMSKGGKGFQISEKVKINTWKLLGKLAGYSRNTLWEVDFILKNLQDVGIRKQLEDGEIKIHKVFKDLKGCAKETDNKSSKISNAKYYIEEKNKYQVVYIRPRWNLSNQISLHDRFIDDLRKMNIEEFTYEKIATLFIQTPSKYLLKTIDLIQKWGFEFVDAITIKAGHCLYASPHANQVHEFLLICKRNNKVPPLPNIQLSDSIQTEDQVFNFIENLISPHHEKVSIFTEVRSGWDVYDFDQASNGMVLKTQPLSNSVSNSTSLVKYSPPINLLAPEHQCRVLTDETALPFQKRIPYFQTTNGELYHGDVLDIMRTRPDHSVDLGITSPPYNRGKNPHYGNKKTGCYPDALREDVYQQSQVEFLNEFYRVLKQTGSLFYNHKDRIRDDRTISPREWIEKSNFIIKQEIIWVNGTPNPDPIRFLPSYERVYWLVKDCKTRLKNVKHLKDVIYSDQWEPQGSDGIHTCRFPLQMPLDILSCFPDAKIILDPYMGSGTTAQAAEMTGRQWIGIELKKEFCDLGAENITKTIAEIKTISEEQNIFEEINLKKRKTLNQLIRNLFYREDCISGARRSLSDESMDLLICDPPFGIKGDKFDKHYNRNKQNVVSGYCEVPIQEYPNFSKEWIKEAERVLKPGGSIYIVSGTTNLIHILNALAETKFQFVNHIIWKYNFGVRTSKKFVTSHYHILYYQKAGGTRTFNQNTYYSDLAKSFDGRSRKYKDMEDVWYIKRDYKRGQVKNQNQLPEELIEKMIRYSSNPNDLVCDFFLGGFTTAKVAMKLNRRVRGFEKNKDAFDYFVKELFYKAKKIA